MVSPGSRKPASADHMPLGQTFWRPIRQRSPITGSMITTGSVRGKCSALQDGQTRFHPPSAAWEGAPQTAQNRWRRRHSNTPLAVAAMAASAGARAMASARISRNSPSPAKGPAEGSVRSSRSTAKTAVSFHMPRNSRVSSTSVRVRPMPSAR